MAINELDKIFACSLALGDGPRLDERWQEIFREKRFKHMGLDWRRLQQPKGRGKYSQRQALVPEWCHRRQTIHYQS